MNPAIIDFVAGQRCASICCFDEYNNPYCFSCFYAFDSRDNLLIYKTSSNSHHYSVMVNRTDVAGTILPDKLNPLAIQGVQFTGSVLPKDHPSTQGASTKYYKRFPFAVTMPGQVVVIQLDEIKMTDNTRGLGTKIRWMKEPVY
ncbi:hypothetical protein [Aridibaculum aurantiacum]|uniref:hypothetical protein n=1 Tax=Aridibaculum aurantiacum TaxID=2810307 RepID=UPI001A97561A|nr:hypothetical protein [Aridibaculum aurantiacum]